MAALARNKSKGFTWDDYQRWPEGERWEIIGGEAFAMTPSPSTRHQRIVGNLYVSLARYFKGRKCELFLSPVDVKLSEQDVVEPDLVVVCNPAQVTARGIEGAPTLVVEVLSPSTALHDRRRKMELFARSGINEVWIVTPYPSSIETYRLQAGAYCLVAVFDKTDTLKSATFPTLRVALSNVFNFPLDPGEEVAMVKEGRPPYRARQHA